MPVLMPVAMRPDAGGAACCSLQYGLMPARCRMIPAMRPAQAAECGLLQLLLCLLQGAVVWDTFKAVLTSLS